jgi:hypothetical protein
MQQLDGSLLLCAINNAFPIFAAARQLSNDKTRNGGFLAITDSLGNQLFGMLVGNVPDPEKRKKYATLALEKCTRLASNPIHVSSWQSRVPEETKVGGAIRLNDERLMGFSGLLSEHLDEAIPLALGHMSGEMSSEQVRKVILASQNNLAHELLPAEFAP